MKLIIFDDIFTQKIVHQCIGNSEVCQLIVNLAIFSNLSPIPNVNGYSCSDSADTCYVLHKFFGNYFGYREAITLPTVEKRDWNRIQFTKIFIAKMKLNSKSNDGIGSAFRGGLSLEIFGMALVILENCYQMKNANYMPLISPSRKQHEEKRFKFFIGSSFYLFVSFPRFHFVYLIEKDIEMHMSCFFSSKVHKSNTSN